MASVAKEVKKALNESKVNIHEFSKNDLNEIRDFILDDDDFYKAYCEYGNFDEYDSYESSVDDFINFLEQDVYSGNPDDDKEVHSFYILDEPGLGYSWMQLKSGKIANLDNIWAEYKSIIRG